MNLQLLNAQLINLNIYLLIAFILTFSLFAAVFALYIKSEREHVRLRKLRNDFTAMMIHELRSPLSIIKSSADLMIKESRNLSEVQIKDMLAQIERSSSELLYIVNDLLDVAKIESGKIELFKHRIKFNSLILDEVTSYKRFANEKGLQVEYSFDEGIDLISCDPEQIKHVVSNLLSNATKFTHEGLITVTTKKYASHIEVAVIDTGIGIPDNIKSRLFDKFVQARNLPVSREKGTGLGLSIVKGIVEAHGGKVWVEDNSPKGSKFVFTLPL